MALEFCDQHKLDALNDLIASRYNGAKARLFKVSHTVAHGDTVSSFTEADFTGYAAITLNAWPAASLDGSFNAISVHPDVTFSMTGTGTTNDIYGVYVTNAAGTQLIGAEENPLGVQHMNASGLTYVVGITVGDNNISPP